MIRAMVVMIVVLMMLPMVMVMAPSTVMILMSRMRTTWIQTPVVELKAQNWGGGHFQKLGRLQGGTCA